MASAQVAITLLNASSIEAVAGRLAAEGYTVTLSQIEVDSQKMGCCMAMLLPAPSLKMDMLGSAIEDILTKAGIMYFSIVTAENGMKFRQGNVTRTEAAKAPKTVWDRINVENPIPK